MPDAARLRRGELILVGPQRLGSESDLS
jgi:hypothetical protein